MLNSICQTVTMRQLEFIATRSLLNTIYASQKEIHRMNNKSRILVVAMLVMALLIVGSLSVFAQTKFPAYISGIQVANLQSDPATITLTAYNSDGSQNGTDLVDQIPGNGSKTYFPISNVDAGFSGAVVISSDKNVAAISNILSSDFSAAASYVGRSSGATEVLLPLLNKDNAGIFTTWFSVQNASTDPASVNIAYSDSTNASASVQPGAAAVFYQSQENHNSPVFAGTVTGDKDVVAAVIQESDKIIFAYTGFSGGATNPVFPLINANNANYVTGLQIQNAGNQATSVTVSYTPSSAGAACTETQTVQPGASGTFALAAFANGSNSDCAAGAKFIGSAAVTGNSTSQPLVGIGNQLLPGVNGEAYGSFDPDAATNVVVMPLIMDRNSNYFTGFNVQNVGGASTSVNCTFSNSSYTVSGTLSPGQALTDLQKDKISDGYVGSGRCEGDAGSKIVAVVNQLQAGATNDQFLVYEGVSP